MAKDAKATLQVEWFNVSYRGVVSGLAVVLALIAAGGGLWYYLAVHAPRTSAQDTVHQAERRFSQASAFSADPGVEEILGNADVSLREAHDSMDRMRYDDARVAAIRSENWSLQVIRLAGGGGEDTELVRFYRLEGDVRVKKSGRFSWDPANSSMVLEIGDQVKTSSSASAQLIYFDGTVTTIQPGSLMEIRELYENPVTKVRRVREKLTWGELKASTQNRNVEGSFHEVATEKVSARSEDVGEFRVVYDKDKKTGKYDVFEGRIEVTSAGRTESLVAGERIKSTSGGQLTDRQALPEVPRLVTPRDQRVFIFEDPLTESVTLSWEPVSSARGYRLVISDRALFTEPLYDAERDTATAILQGVEPASYFWKVSAISPSGVTGAFTQPRRFRVSSQKIRDRADKLPPALEITEFVPIGMMVIVNGRTEPGAGLWVDNEKIDVYDDGTFYAVVRLRKEGLNTLRFVAQDNAGNEAKLTKSAHVELH